MINGHDIRDMKEDSIPPRSKREFAIEWDSRLLGRGWVVVEQEFDTMAEAVRKMVSYQRMFPKQDYRVYEVIDDPKRRTQG